MTKLLPILCLFFILASSVGCFNGDRHLPDQGAYTYYYDPYYPCDDVCTANRNFAAGTFTDRDFALEKLQLAYPGYVVHSQLDVNTDSKPPLVVNGTRFSSFYGATISAATLQEFLDAVALTHDRPVDIKLTNPITISSPVNVSGSLHIGGEAISFDGTGSLVLSPPQGSQPPMMVCNAFNYSSQNKLSSTEYLQISLVLETKEVKSPSIVSSVNSHVSFVSKVSGKMDLQLTGLYNIIYVYEGPLNLVTPLKVGTFVILNHVNFDPSQVLGLIAFDSYPITPESDWSDEQDKNFCLDYDTNPGQRENYVNANACDKAEWMKLLRSWDDGWCGFVAN